MKMMSDDVYAGRIWGLVHGGACAKDMQAHEEFPRVPTGRVVVGTVKLDGRTGEVIEESPVVESYHITASGSILVNGPGRNYSQEGYDFQI